MARLAPVLLLCAFSTGPVAQTAGPESGQQDRPAGVTGNEERNTENAPARDTPRTDTPDRFQPSEEISEDLSVSFPVDI